MPKRRSAPNTRAARLTVLASANSSEFLPSVLALLASPQRLDREAALEALAAHPLPEARVPARDLFLELHADGAKREAGGAMRGQIVRILRAIGDVRDRDIALLAAGAHEIAFGDDTTWRLRAEALTLLAATAPDIVPFVAVEQLGDATHDGEPAKTALALLAGAGHYLPIYQWLLAADPADPLVPIAFELLVEAPPDVVARYASATLGRAARAGNEGLVMMLCEAIVRIELEGCYASIGEAMFAKTSDELYAYLAMLLAGTGRAPLLALLDDQLRRGRRPRLVAEALRVRPTPETEAMLRRWEDGD
jgi:hypothetical protein